MKSAERMKYFRPSVFSRLDEEKRRLQEKGEKIIDFSIGSPDIAPAPHIMEALLKAAEDPASDPQTDDDPWMWRDLVWTYNGKSCFFPFISIGDPCAGNPCKRSG